MHENIVEKIDKEWSIWYNDKSVALKHKSVSMLGWPFFGYLLFNAFVELR